MKDGENLPCLKKVSCGDAIQPSLIRLIEMTMISAQTQASLCSLAAYDSYVCEVAAYATQFMRRVQTCCLRYAF